ncbi:hypothetical protein M2281_004973 [Mesorhizobium soli]|uniref:DUF937 domain-containing protein n=1 Tax=Pseudaminobacter soli (ex Li et al. 2025) TaxID=1295366 RepID=UPI0024757073|nr:DUF937 domain-containing protein [Mesorhizobium soli]MDH6234355.1 hypothetical protein [Mesorhizobium soli]
MTTNLISHIMQSLTPDMMSRIGTLVGLDQNVTEQAASAIVPALLGGFGKIATTPDGARKLYDTVARQPTGTFDNLTQMLAGSDRKSLVENGLNTVSSLLGGSATQTLAGAVSKFAGTNQGAASSLMGVLAPVVTGALAKETVARGLDVAGLAQLLKSQSSHIQAALPPAFSDILKGAGLLGDIATPPPPRAAATTAASPTVDIQAQRAAAQRASATPSTANWLYWAIPAILIAGGAWWWLGERTNQAGPQVAQQQTGTEPQQGIDPGMTAGIPGGDLKTRATQALAALNAVPGGADVAKQTASALDEVKTSLSQVSDAATAQTAVPKLQEADAELGKVNGLAAQLPATGRTALATLISANMPTINAQLDKVLALPGVGPILKQPVDTLRSNLDSLSKAPA